MVGDELDRVGQQLVRLGLGLVLAAAVGRLDQDVVGIGHDRRVAQDRGPGPAEVAREDEAQLGPAVLIGDPQTDDRRAEDVAGVDIRRVDPGRDLDLGVVVDPPERGERGLGVLGVVERLVELDIEDRRLLDAGPAPDRGRPRGDDRRRRDLRCARRTRRHWRRSAAPGSRPDRRRRPLPGARPGTSRAASKRRLPKWAGSWRGSSNARRSPTGIATGGRPPSSFDFAGRRGSGGRCIGRVERAVDPVGGQRPRPTPARRCRASRTCAAFAGIALLAPDLALRELLLELARVEQDEGRQLDRALRRPDRSREAGLDDVRDQAAVVEVGMGQQDRVDRLRVVGQRNPVADRLVRAALEHPAIDQDRGPVGGQQILRTGHGRGRPEELEVHPRSLPPRAWSGRPRSEVGRPAHHPWRLARSGHRSRAGVAELLVHHHLESRRSDRDGLRRDPGLRSPGRRGGRRCSR